MGRLSWLIQEVIPSVYKREAGGDFIRKRKDNVVCQQTERVEDAMLCCCVKTKGDAMSPSARNETLEAGKRSGNGLTPRAFGGSVALPTS